MANKVVTKYSVKRIAAVCISFFLLAGCSRSDELQSHKSQIKIALITKSGASYFWQIVLAGARSAAVEYGIEIVMYAPETEGDYQTQIMYVENAVKDGYDAILFSSCDYEKTAPAIAEALESGVKVVTIDSGIYSMPNLVFIGTDNIKAGYRAAEALDGLSEGELKIGVINFESFSANAIDREAGFIQYVDEHPHMEIVDARSCISNRKDPRNATHEMLDAHPEINAIAAFNEWMTLGVGEALVERGIKDELSAVAFDNNAESVVLLEKGVLDALIVQNPFAMGYLGVENALAQIERHKPGETIIYTDSAAITAENMYDIQNQKLLFPFVE